MDLWSSHGHYIELIAPQRDPKWFQARECRATASSYEALLGFSRFKTDTETADIIVGKTQHPFTTEAMQLGIDNEDNLRKEYAKQYNVVITEPSLCVPIWDIDFVMSWTGKRLSETYGPQLSNPLHPNWFIGGSPDGEIVFQDGTTGNLEIKFTKRMYRPLIQHGADVLDPNWKAPPRFVDHYDSALASAFSDDCQEHNMESPSAVDYHSHIWQSHYMQMQGCMAILNKSKCAYVVGTFGSFYTEIVPFDSRYFYYFLYPSLIRAVENKLKPAMSSTQLQQFSNRITDIIATFK